LFEGLFPGPGRDDVVRASLQEEARRDGWDVLHRRLESLDPEYATKIGPNDRIRIIRALEVRAVTGIPLSEHFHLTKGYLQGFAPVLIGLRRDRTSLGRRVDDRVEQMFQRGLVEEVRGLRAGGLEENAPPFKALGYRHVLRFLRGESTLEEARLERDRHPPLRQTTGDLVPQDAGLVWFDADDVEAIIDFIAGQRKDHG